MYKLITCNTILTVFMVYPFHKHNWKSTELKILSLLPKIQQALFYISSTSLIYSKKIILFSFFNLLEYSDTQYYIGFSEITLSKFLNIEITFFNKDIL